MKLLDHYNYPETVFTEKKILEINIIIKPNLLHSK